MASASRRASSHGVKASARVSAAKRIRSSRRPSLARPERNRERQRRAVEVLTQAPLEQGIAIAALDIGQVFQLETFLGDVREQEEQAAAMLFEVSRECFQARRLVAELGFELDAAGSPIVGGESGAVSQQYAFRRHQVFILVMMS
jgi:acyl CoA:acetate/3-ketoacid CoA transferase alpha subunit